ncbi:MAG: peptidylprolyl isomerase [Acidobacteria bacterium]|nr:peptidylprolyl isomerase [Acidobacteriota bacterium]
MGNITIEFYADDSPTAVENFRLLAEHGYYDGLTFHRVVEGFMIQGGDPRGDGTGGESAWGGEFDDDIDRGSALYRRGYRRGIVAMANAGPDTNGSQFFIMHGNSRLQPNYVIFGNVVEGLPVVDALASVPTARSSSGEMSRPTRPLVIRKVEILP